MDTKVIVGIVVVVAVLVAVPLVGKVMQQDGAAEQSAEPAAATPASAPAPAPVAVQPPALNAASLANTKWAMKVQGFDVTFTLLPGGQALAESPLLERMTQQKQVQGSWSVSGANLTVSVEVMGKTQSATAVISGNSLLVDGQPITRLQ